MEVQVWGIRCNWLVTQSYLKDHEANDMLDRSAPHGAYWLCLITLLYHPGDWQAHTKPRTSTNNAKLQTTISSRNNSLLRTRVSENSLLISWAWVGLMQSKPQTECFKYPAWSKDTIRRNQPPSDVLSKACQHHSDQNSVRASQSTITLLFPLTTYTTVHSIKQKM